MGGMPKSAFAANAQAKVCAAAVVAKLAGREPVDPRLINTCYSLVAPDYGITVAGVYKPDKGQLVDIPGAGGISPLEADAGLPCPGGALRRGLVPHHHGRDLRLGRVRLLGCPPSCWRCLAPPRPPRRNCAPT